MHFNELNLNGALEEFISTSRILGLKMQKINFLKTISVLICSFYQIKVQVITNLFCRLEKHLIIEFLLMTKF